MTYSEDSEKPYYLNGSVVTYYCVNGYEILPTDQDEIVCADGSWQGVVGNCYSGSALRMYAWYMT